jgi:hypothetical protein
MRLDLKSFSRSRAHQGLEGRPGRSRGEIMSDQVKKYFVSFMDADTVEVLQGAQQDLIFGPSPEGGALGFDNATKRLSRWWKAHGYDIWYDRNSGVVYDSRPSKEQISGGSFVSLSKSEARVHVFGETLARYVAP